MLNAAKVDTDEARARIDRALEKAHTEHRRAEELQEQSDRAAARGMAATRAAQKAAHEAAGQPLRRRWWDHEFVPEVKRELKLAAERVAAAAVAEAVKP